MCHTITGNGAEVRWNFWVICWIWHGSANFITVWVFRCIANLRLVTRDKKKRCDILDEPFGGISIMSAWEMVNWHASITDHWLKTIFWRIGPELLDIYFALICVSYSSFSATLGFLCDWNVKWTQNRPHGCRKSFVFSVRFSHKKFEQSNNLEAEQRHQQLLAQNSSETMKQFLWDSFFACSRYFGVVQSMNAFVGTFPNSARELGRNTLLFEWIPYPRKTDSCVALKI